jgi:L-ribulose-5-phosphate 3-epimerase
MNAQERAGLLAFLRQNSLSIETLNVPSTDVNLCSVNRDMREYTVAELTRVMQMASDLEIPYVTCVAGRRLNFNAPDPQLTLGWLDGGLEALSKHASELGVSILLELHPMSCLPTTSEMVGYLDRLNDARLGLAFDVTNSAYVGERPDESIKKAARWLRQVHLSDARSGRWEHDIVGVGDLDFGSIVSALEEINFAGTAIIEISCDDPDHGYVVSKQVLEHVQRQSGQCAAS